VSVFFIRPQILPPIACASVAPAAKSQRLCLQHERHIVRVCQLSAVRPSRSTSTTANIVLLRARRGDVRRRRLYANEMRNAPEDRGEVYGEASSRADRRSCASVSGSVDEQAGRYSSRGAALHQQHMSAAAKMQSQAARMCRKLYEKK